MKRFLSVLAVAGLLMGFASCSKDDEPNPGPNPPDNSQEVLEDLFGSNIPDFITNENTPPAEVRPDATLSLSPFEAVYPWKVSVETSVSRSAKSSLGSRAEQVQFMLSQSPDGSNPNTEFSGSGDGSMVQLYLVSPAEKPESGAIGAEVNLSVTDKTGTNYNFTMYEAYINSGTNSFAIYSGIPVNPIPEDGNLWEMNAEGDYLYEATATTSLTLITGDFNPQVRFLVDSDNPWIVSGVDNLPLTFNPQSGNAGETGVLAQVSYYLQPIEDINVEVNFVENTESADAATLGTVTIPVPGCGNTVSLFGRSLSSEILVDANGETIYSDGGNYWIPIGEEGLRVLVEAAYGSQIYFVSEDNWIKFIDEITFEETDGDIDLTKYNLQTVGGPVIADFNPENTTRTAYLIGVPANKVEEVGVSPEEALVNGQLNSKLEDYVLSTVTQKASYSESEAWALVNWDEGLGYDRSDLADLFIIRQSNELYQDLFVQNWKYAPVAFGINYFSIEAPEYAGVLAVSSDITSAKFYGLYTPYQLESGYESVDWAKLELSNGILEIHPAYDYTNGTGWEVTFPEEIDMNNLTGYISLMNSEGEVVTFIQIVLNAEANSSDPTNPTQKIADARGWQGDKWESLSLKPLGEGDEGYDPDYEGEQYGLEMGNYSVVSFGTVPSGNPEVIDPISGEPMEGVLFTRQSGNFFYLETQNEKGAIYVAFNNAGVRLYVTYNFVEDDTEGFTLTHYQLGSEDSSNEYPITSLSAGDTEYDSSLDVDAQYYINLTQEASTIIAYYSKSVADIKGEFASITLNGEDVTSEFLSFLSVESYPTNTTIGLPAAKFGDPSGEYELMVILKDASSDYSVSLKINVDVE